MLKLSILCRIGSILSFDRRYVRILAISPETLFFYFNLSFIRKILGIMLNFCSCRIIYYFFRGPSFKLWSFKLYCSRGFFFFIL